MSNKEKNTVWTTISPLLPVPLFDQNSEVARTFSRDAYERHKKEIDDCAEKAGFIKIAKFKKNGSVTFMKP